MGGGTGNERATTVLIISQTPWHAAWERLLALASVVAVIGLGVLLNSEAMQWLGFLCVILSALLLALRQGKSRVTPQEAADRLLRDFGVVGQRTVSMKEAVSAAWAAVDSMAAHPADTGPRPD
jgi:hypothetical protein